MRKKLPLLDLLLKGLSLWVWVGFLHTQSSSLPAEGEKTLWATRFQEPSPRGVIPDLEIRRGALEVIKKNGTRWLRPRVLGTGAVLPVSLRGDFSFAFRFLTHPEGNPYLRIFLHTADGIQHWGDYGGPRVLELRTSREGPDDVVCLYTRETPFVEPLPPKGEIRVRADVPHQVLLVVRDGIARLYVDGQRVTAVRFHPSIHPAGLGWSWYHTYDTRAPFPESSVWITDLRLAAYLQPSSEQYRRARAVLMVQMDPTRIPDSLLKTWKSKLHLRKVSEGYWIPFPVDPFPRSGTWEIDTPVPSRWAEDLVKFMRTIRARDSSALLVIRGKTPEMIREDVTFWGRQVPFWLAALRAREVLRWLITGGLDPRWLHTLP